MCGVGLAIKIPAPHGRTTNHKARYPQTRHRFPHKEVERNSMAAATASSTLLPARTFSSARSAPGTAGQCLPRRVGSRPSPSSVCISSGRTRRAEAVRASAGGTGGAPAAALPEALLFDCDGVLVDTEKDGHRISFNETFAEVLFLPPYILISRCNCSPDVNVGDLCLVVLGIDMLAVHGSNLSEANFCGN